MRSGIGGQRWGVLSEKHILFAGSEQQETHQQLRLVISDAHQHDTQECRARESPPTADSHALRAAEECGSLCPVYVRSCINLKSRKVHLQEDRVKVPVVFKPTLCLQPGSACRFAPCPLREGFLWQGGFLPDGSGRGRDLICCHFLNSWTQTLSKASLPFCHRSSLRINEMNIYWRREMSRWRRFWKTLTWTQTSKE